MFTVSGATSGLDGIISRQRIIHKNTRKASMNLDLYTSDPQIIIREIYAGKGEAGERKFLAA